MLVSGCAPLCLRVPMHIGVLMSGYLPWDHAWYEGTAFTTYVQGV